MGVRGFVRRREDDSRFGNLEDEVEASIRSIIGMDIINGVLVENKSIEALNSSHQARVSSTSGAVITLGTASDAAKFKAGDLIRCSAQKMHSSTPEILVRPGIMKVTASDAAAGTVTTEDLAPNLANNDYLYFVKANTVKHKLGRKPKGYLVVRSNMWGAVWGDVFTDAKLTLYSENNVTVSLWVF